MAGIDVRDVATLRQYVAYIPTEPIYYECMTLRATISFLRALYARWNDDWCMELLGRFDIDVNRKMGEFSHGTRVRIAIALSLTFAPSVLLIDEAAGALDPAMRFEVLQLLKAQASKLGMAVVISSHIIGDIQEVADWIGIIHNRHLVCSSQIKELCTKVKRVRIHDPPAGIADWTLGSMLAQYRGDGEWTFVVADYSPMFLSNLTEKCNLKNVEVQVMNLEEIVRAYLGNSTAASSPHS